MAKTVVGIYDDSNTAEKVVRDLENNGFDRKDISLVARDQMQGKSYGDETAREGSDTGSHAAAGAGAGAVLGGLAGLVVGLGALAIPGIGPIIAAGPIAAALAGAGIGAAAGGLIGALTSAGVPEEDAHTYAEGVRRGGTLVMVNSPDDMADQAAAIMNRYHPTNIDMRRGEWQQQGNWNRFDETAQPYTDEQMVNERNQRQSRTVQDTGEHVAGRDFATDTSDVSAREGEQHIPVVEEDVNVEKRQVQGGGVRVHTYVTEKPFEETHQLRDETVNVERRPADRPASPADLDAFQERSFEVTETNEELIVDKSAHVVEDVVVSKSVEERPETVRETLRRQDVDTENIDAGRTTRGTHDFSSFNADFHNHYNTVFGSSGRDYSYYEPGYRYGYDLAGNQQYRSRRWSEIEPDVRRDWERTHQNSAWNDFRDAIRYGWERSSSGAQDMGSSTGGTFTDQGDQGYETGTRDNL